jgi:hypothetical protein
LPPLPLAAYNLWCARRDRGRIDATRIADRAPSPTSRLRAREIRRLKLDAFREPDRSIACPGGHVGTTNKSKASRRLTTAVDRLRLVPERELGFFNRGWLDYLRFLQQFFLARWIPAIPQWPQSIVRDGCDRVAFERRQIWLSMHHSPYPPSQSGVSQDQSISSRESQEATVRILTSRHYTKTRFETPSNGSKPPALRSLRTANRGSITISRRTASMGFRTWPRTVSRSRSRTVIRAACRGACGVLSATGGTETVTWMSPCATLMCRSSRR